MKKIIALAIFLMAFTSASAAINSPNVFGASLTEGSVIFQGKNAPDFGDYSASYTQLAFDALIGFNSRIGLHTGLGLMLNVAIFTNGDDDTGYGTHSSDDVDDDMTIGNIMARFVEENIYGIIAPGAVAERNDGGGIRGWGSRLPSVAIIATNVIICAVLIVKMCGINADGAFANAGGKFVDASVVFILWKNRNVLFNRIAAEQT